MSKRKDHMREAVRARAFYSFKVGGPLGGRDPLGIMEGGPEFQDWHVVDEGPNSILIRINQKSEAPRYFQIRVSEVL